MLDSSQVEEEEELPPLLQVLLTEKFFNACLVHEDSKKNEKNIYCLDCCFSICSHCLPLHTSHRLLQIRRYVYQDVIRLSDAQKLLDCSFVQSYTTNSAKVVFIKPRPQIRQFRGSGNFCYICGRSLQDPYLFCSLSCKIDHILKRKDGPNGLSLGFLLHCESFSLPEPDGFMTTESAGTGSGGNGGVGCRTVSSTATTSELVVIRKKRSSLSSASCIIPKISVSLMNRRKKAPNRAPLY